MIYSYMKYTNSPSYKTAISWGCKQVDEFEDDVNEITKVYAIKYIIISHFHPDHMGIAQDIAGLGVTIVVLDIQLKYIHAADIIWSKDKRKINFD